PIVLGLFHVLSENRSHLFFQFLAHVAGFSRRFSVRPQCFLPEPQSSQCYHTYQPHVGLVDHLLFRVLFEFFQQNCCQSSNRRNEFHAQFWRFNLIFCRCFSYSCSSCLCSLGRVTSRSTCLIRENRSIVLLDELCTCPLVPEGRTALSMMY